jgi:hypothetical protein
VYPVTVAAAAGIDIAVKLTRSQARPGSFIHLLASALAAAGCKITLLPADFRVPSDRDANPDSIMIFGDDETIHALRSQTSASAMRLIGHGEAIAMTSSATGPSTTSCQKSSKTHFP